MNSADNVTIYFLKDIAARKKAYIRNEDIQTVYVPQYEGLYLKDIAEFATQYPIIASYMPDEPDLPKTPKQWIINVAYTIIGQPFADWVMQVVTERNMKLQQEQNLMINIDPEVKAAWAQSTLVSCKSTSPPAPAPSLLILNLSTNKRTLATACTC